MNYDNLSLGDKDLMIDEKIVCKICGREFKTVHGLSLHVYQTHKINTSEYYIKYLKQNKEGFCVVCGKGLKCNGIRGFFRTCSNSCSKKDPKTIQKTKETMLLKYGVDNIFKDTNKIKQSYIKKLGTSNPSKLESVQKKKEETSFKNFGVRFTQQSPSVQNKTKITSLKHYGVDNVFKSKIIKDKTINTNLKKYGVKHNQQNCIIKQKSRQTCLEHFGVLESLSSPIIRAKGRLAAFKKYGVDHFFKTDQGKDIARSNMIKRLLEVKKLTMDEIRSQLIGPTEAIFISKLKPRLDDLKIKYIHQYYVSNSFVDLYLPDLNISIEFDESHHFIDFVGGELTIDDKKRQTRIEQKTGCIFIRINISDWKIDQTKVINSIMEFINGIKQVAAAVH